MSEGVEWTAAAQGGASQGTHLRIWSILHCGSTLARARAPSTPIWLMSNLGGRRPMHAGRMRRDANASEQHGEAGKRTRDV